MRFLTWLGKRPGIFYIFSLGIGLCILCVFFFKLRGISTKTYENFVNRDNLLHFVKSNVDHVQNNTFQGNKWSFDGNEFQSNLSNYGVLNVHTWGFACELTLQKFVQNPLFPISPNVQAFVNNLELKWMEQKSKDVKKFGRRIFGYLFVPHTGNFKFSMSSSFDAELWLSRDHHWRNLKLLCKSGSSLTDENLVSKSRNSKENYSSEIRLKQGRPYFIEILLMHSPPESFYLKWKAPHSEIFEEILNKFLHPYMGESLRFKEFIKTVPLTLATQSYINSHPKQSILSSTKKLHSGVKSLEWNDVNLALPVCRYQPDYVGKRVWQQYYAVEHYVNPSYVYPELKHAMIKDGKWDPWFPLDQKDALGIVEKYLKHVEGAYPGKYKLKEMLNIERKPDWHKSNREFYKGTLKHGDRFFLELLLWDNTNNKEVILSEYVYQHKKNKTLCYPEGMHWNKTAPVYLLISCRKQSAWVWHFIKNVERLYQSTGDENLHVIVYDYNSTNIDIEAAFQQSLFKNYKILFNPDSKYSRTYSLNRAADAVTDPNAIVFTLDLHLEIPLSFANNVRKHCIKGKMVYTPIISRLSCGASPRYLHGSWDPWGYGMFGAYKSDWANFNGFDEVKFKTRWGGEDWDLVDRAYRVGLEFERIKIADFYHYDHSRVGLWT